MTNKRFIIMLTVGAVLIALGSLITSHLESFLKVVMIVAGIAALADGVYTLIGIKKWEFTNTTRTLSQIKGFESVAIGVAAVLIALFLETALSIMVYIFAAGLIFSSIVSFQNVFMGKKSDIPYLSNRFVVEGVITLLIAIILICKPVESLLMIAKVFGIFIIVIGALAVGFAVIGKIIASKATAGATTEVGEAEVVEEVESDRPEQIES